MGARRHDSGGDGRPRPRIAVFKFASCDGCQLTLLDLEDQLLQIFDEFELAYFREVTSLDSEGPFDVTLVDGSIATRRDEERIRVVRSLSRHLVSIGACATAGGIQALRNFQDIDAFRSQVYARPEYVDTLATSTAVAEHVPVDFELRGCPIDKGQLLEVLSAFLAGRRPSIAAHSVCLECKLRGNVCVMVTGTPCLGPVTHGGCGALCPSYDRGCYGCFGPMETPNTASLSHALSGSGMPRRNLLRVYRTFQAAAPAFHDEAEALERAALEHSDPEGEDE